MQRYDLQGHPIIERRASGGAAALAAVMLQFAEVLEPKPARDLGAEVVDAPADDPLLELRFGPLEPLD
jgi:hypothetical protein